MNVDAAIQQAIQLAVHTHGQPAAVTDKLVKWLDEVISGNESIDNEEAVFRRLDNLCASVTSDIEEKAS
jgi:hypothetical protein